MARIINIVNAKGGTGKTTTAVNLSAYLAAMGKYVLLVDLDAQANATSGLGVKIDEDHPHIYHAIVNQEPLPSIIKKTSLFGFDILPAGASLAGASVELVSVDNRELCLKNSLNSVRTNYDYIIIDSAPSLSLLTVNGLAAAEEIIIPVQCEYYALEGLKQLLDTIGLVQKHLKPSLRIAGALLTMHDNRNTLSKQVVEEVKNHFPYTVFQAIVPRTSRLAEAPSHGKTILHYDPHSKGARAYEQLAQEIISKEINFSI